MRTQPNGYGKAITVAATEHRDGKGINGEWDLTFKNWRWNTYNNIINNNEKFRITVHRHHHVLFSFAVVRWGLVAIRWWRHSIRWWRPFIQAQFCCTMVKKKIWMAGTEKKENRKVVDDKVERDQCTAKNHIVNLCWDIWNVTGCHIIEWFICEHSACCLRTAYTHDARHAYMYWLMSHPLRYNDNIQ